MAKAENCKTLRLEVLRKSCDAVLTRMHAVWRSLEPIRQTVSDYRPPLPAIKPAYFVLVRPDGFGVHLEVSQQLLNNLAYCRRLLDESAFVELRERHLELLSICLKRGEEPHPHLVVALRHLAIELEAVDLRHPH